MAPLDHRRHFDSLDGVRGIAVLMVFCHHLCPYAANTPLGALCATLWLGVDLFFVLSGFLITGVLYDTLRQPRFFRNFYARRALRLLPVYVVLVALVLVANAALGGRPTVWAVPFFLYGSNIVRDLRLPLGLAPQLDVSHLWSLAVEEQFYLLWPLCIFLARSGRNVLVLCASGIALSVCLRELYLAAPSTFPLGTPYFELPMRLDSLLLGGAVAVLLRDPRGRGLLRPRLLNVLLAIGLAAVALAFVQAGHGSMFTPPMVRYGYLAAALAFAAWIALAVRSGSWVAQACNRPALRAFGRCSYGLYLIHLVPRFWYFLLLQRAQAACSSGWQRAAASTVLFLLYLGLCFAVATFSYRTLERFFLRRKRNFRYADEPTARAAQAATGRS